MRRLITASAPILPGEDVIDGFPKADDPRWGTFLAQCRAQGVMDADGTSLVACKLRRGADTTNFLMEVEWDDAPVDAAVTRYR